MWKTGEDTGKQGHEGFTNQFWSGKVPLYFQLKQELPVAVTIAIVQETADHEKRVAATPETVKKLSALGAKIVIERGAGLAAAYTDKSYEDAGATLASDAAAAVSGADIVLKVQAGADDVAALGTGKILIGQFAPYQNKDVLESAAAKGVTALSMELVPRITRAQAMDVLSSQSNLAGYKAVLDAAGEFTRAFPMMMTAAGTVAPARVFVMGAGVAGLQAIATAKRLGAVVSATDVRPAAKEQVESLGGTFIAVQDEEFKSAETAGGYAKEMSAEYKAKQAALIEETIAKQDIVITTALIPGRPAPRLVTAKMVESMKPGSVVVDLAVESGGNVELSKAGEVVVHNGVKIVGHCNVPSRLATDASALYAKNLFNLVGLMIDKETGTLAINWDDEIIKGIALTHDGKIVHPNFADKS